MFNYCPDENYGFVPEEEAPQDVAEFNAMCGRYNPHGQPAIVSWDSFASFAQEKAAEATKLRTAGWCVFWWDIARRKGIPLWASNQGQLGSCAGWAAANGHMTMVLYQMMLGAFRFTLINPLAMWARTKNWSLRGGQSMPAVLMGGNRFGNYPVKLVGAYSTQLSRETISKIEAATEEARLHQFGACRLSQTANGGRLSGTDLAKRIALCLRAGLVVPIGNSIRISGCKTDKNGVRVANLGGNWMHATLLDAYECVNGTEYFHCTNSHGDRYKGVDLFQSPESGCWLTWDQLVQYCSGRYGDAFCIYFAEAPVDTERTSFTPATRNRLVA